MGGGGQRLQVLFDPALHRKNTKVCNESKQAARAIVTFPPHASAPTLAHIKAPASTVEFPGVPEARSSVAKTARTSSTHQAYSFSNHPERGAAYSTGANATATVAGQAHEPSASQVTVSLACQFNCGIICKVCLCMQSAQLDKSASSLANPRGKPIQKRRVLTATAKGMQHWSKYKHHSQMLFEVFGE